MGTGFEVDASPEAAGIIPRAVDHLFRGIQERQEAARRAGQPPADFKISAQFMELYNEEVIDLLDQSGANRVSSPCSACSAGRHWVKVTVLTERCSRS